MWHLQQKHWDEMHKEVMVGRANVNLNMTQQTTLSNDTELRFWVYTAPVADRFRLNAFLSWSSLRGFFHSKASPETFKPFSPLYNTFWHSSWLSFVFPGASLYGFILFSTQSLLLSTGLVPTCCLCSPYPLLLSHFYITTLMACITGSDFIAGGQ